MLSLILVLYIVLNLACIVIAVGIWIRLWLRHRDTKPALQQRTPNSGAIFFRIKGIPRDWSKKDLLESLRKIDSSFQRWDPDRDQLSLNPSCYGSGQTAIVNARSTIEFLQNIGPEDSKYIRTSRSISDENIYLLIERHFYNLTPLNTPVRR